MSDENHLVLEKVYLLSTGLLHILKLASKKGQARENFELALQWEHFFCYQLKYLL